MTEEQVVRHIHENKENRPDSITLGTPSKGGELKVYFNATAPMEEIRGLIDRALAVRSYAAAMHDGGKS
jgi:hypothetical protein